VHLLFAFLYKERVTVEETRRDEASGEASDALRFFGQEREPRLLSRRHNCCWQIQASL
jgi:hypothetical protein